MENVHVFYITIIVILTGLFAHAHYWLARTDAQDWRRPSRGGARPIQFARAYRQPAID